MLSEKLQQAFLDGGVQCSPLESRLVESYSPTIDGLTSLSSEKLEVICSNAVFDLKRIERPELVCIRRTVRVLAALLLKKMDRAAFGVADVVFLFLDQTKQLDEAPQQEKANKLQALIVQDLWPARVRGLVSDSQRLFLANEFLTTSDLRVVSSSTMTASGKLTIHGHNASAFSFVMNSNGVIGATFSPSIDKLNNLATILDHIKRAEFSQISHAEALEVANFVEELVSSGVLNDLVTVAELRFLSQDFSKQPDKVEKFITWARNFEDTPITTSIEAILRIVRGL